MRFMAWKEVRTMIFSELYGVYYKTVASILKAAVDHPLQENEINQIVEKHAFGESMLTIPAALKEGKWQLLRDNGTTPLNHAPAIPLTLLQKRWLKAIMHDPRIQLFTDEPLDFPDVEPLFLQEDIYIFDKYVDGDDYKDPSYIRDFRLIMDAIQNQYPLTVAISNKNGVPIKRVVMPEYLEYSEKDDKFRLIGAGNRFGNTINLGRIVSCERCLDPEALTQKKNNPIRPRSVTFELYDKRNAMERVLLHFAHFEKRAEKIDDGHYKVTIYYDKDDETEIVIRVLSFGPMLKVIAPKHFVGLIKQRLLDQKSCEL